MYLIALTGGIASGKSTVARRLVEHGAVLVDADLLARDAVEPGMPALAAIRAEFGDGVFAPDGTLNRAALGAIVFADPAALERLNAITHPAIWALVEQCFAAAAPDDIVVYDVALLVESAALRPPHMDLVVVVHADRQTRLDRLVELRGMSADAARDRVDSQASDEQRLAIADVVIDTNGTLEQTYAQVDSVWERATAAVHAR